MTTAWCTLQEREAWLLCSRNMSHAEMKLLQCVTVIRFVQASLRLRQEQHSCNEQVHSSVQGLGSGRSYSDPGMLRRRPCQERLLATGSPGWCNDGQLWGLAGCQPGPSECAPWPAQGSVADVRTVGCVSVRQMMLAWTGTQKRYCWSTILLVTQLPAKLDIAP